MLKRLSSNFYFFIIIMQVVSLNARFLDVAMFLDWGQELFQAKNKSGLMGPITSDLGVAFCQKSFPILTTSTLLYNLQNIKKTSIINEPKYKILKDMILDDKEWDIYQHRSRDLYLLIPKIYINSLAKYNTKEFKSEAAKYPQFTSDEILTGFRINPKVSIFKKVSWKNLDFDSSAQYYSNFEKWAQTDKKSSKNVNWLEIFTQGNDDIFGLWNISLDGHGGYSKDFLSKVGIPKDLNESSKADDNGGIAGLSFNGYKNFIQFLTNNVKTNFLYYTTCFGGDANLVLPYITTVLNSEGIVKGDVKKPNFTIAAGALTSESVIANSTNSLIQCAVKTANPKTVSYSMFFESLRKYAPEATKAVIYKDKELKEILVYITDRVKHQWSQGITALPSVMFPGSELFRAVELDNTVSVISEVLLKTHTLAIKGGKFTKEAKPIVLQNKEVILIYPLEIPVEIKIVTEKDKLAPAIVAMTAGMSITKINRLNINIGLFKFLNGCMGAVTPVFNKYFFINSLTVLNNILTYLEVDDKKIGYDQEITLKNVLILVKGLKANDKLITIIFTAPNNKIYTWKYTTQIVFKPTELNIPVTNSLPDNDYINSLITYFDSNDTAIAKIKTDFDFDNLSKLLSKDEKEILQKFDKENGTFNAKFKEHEKQTKAEKDKALKDKLAQDKAYKAKVAKEKAAKEKTAKDKIAKEKSDKEKAAKDKITKDKADKDKATRDKASTAANAMADKDKAIQDKAAKDKITKEKANKNLAAKVAALQEKQFKDTSTKLLNLANIFQEFKQAQTGKNVKKINQLKRKVNLAIQNLKKLNVNIKNQNGQTPIMVNPSIAPVVYGLNKNIAKNVVNAKDPKGKTVLQYTIQSPFADKIYIYNALVSSGAKINNNDIKTAQIKLKNKPKLKNPIVKLLQIGQKKNK